MFVSPLSIGINENLLSVYKSVIDVGQETMPSDIFARLCQFAPMFTDSILFNLKQLLILAGTFESLWFVIS